MENNPELERIILIVAGVLGLGALVAKLPDILGAAATKLVDTGILTATDVLITIVPAVGAGLDLSRLIIATGALILLVILAVSALRSTAGAQGQPGRPQGPRR